MEPHRLRIPENRTNPIETPKESIALSWSVGVGPVSLYSYKLQVRLRRGKIDTYGQGRNGGKRIFSSLKLEKLLRLSSKEGEVGMRTKEARKS